MVNDPLAARVQLELHTRDMTWGDTMTIRVQGLNRRGQPVDAGDARLEVRNDSVLYQWEPLANGGRIYARTLGSSWVVGIAGEMRDSVHISSTSRPLRVRAHVYQPWSLFVDADGYSPADGVCYTHTAEEHLALNGRPWNWTEMGAWLVDYGGTRLLRIAPEYTLDDEAVLEMGSGAEPMHVRYRPRGAGAARIEMQDGGFTHALPVYVDPVNRCVGIVPGLRSAKTSNVPQVYAW